MTTVFGGDIDDTLATRMENALKMRKMSQKALAERAGITEAAVSHYIKGDRTPNSMTIKAIAEALDVSASFLLGPPPKEAAAEGAERSFLHIRGLVLDIKEALTDEQRFDLIRILSEPRAIRTDSRGES